MLLAWVLHAFSMTPPCFQHYLTPLCFSSFHHFHSSHRNSNSLYFLHFLKPANAKRTCSTFDWLVVCTFLTLNFPCNWADVRFPTVEATESRNLRSNARLAAANSDAEHRYITRSNTNTLDVVLERSIDEIFGLNIDPAAVDPDEMEELEERSNVEGDTTFTNWEHELEVHKLQAGLQDKQWGYLMFRISDG